MKRQARLMLISFRIQKVGKTTTVHMSRRRKKNKDPNEVEFNGEVAKLQKN
jgi:hypothetical protein